MTLNLTDSEYQALLEAVTLLSTELSQRDDDSGAERLRGSLNSAWSKVLADHRFPKRRVPSKRRMRCPDCGRGGVTLRLRPASWDFYKCAYCNFECYSVPPPGVDRGRHVERIQALADVNTDHIDAPSKEI